MNKNKEYMSIFESTITKIDKPIEYSSGKIKSTFYVGKKYTKCVYWNKIYAAVGDKVAMKGFKKNEVIIVDNIMVMPNTNGNIYNN